MHLRGSALEEAATAADEERIAREDGAVGTVLEVIAYAVLGVAGGVESSHFDVFSDGEGGVVGRGGGDLVAVFAADDGQLEVLELVGEVSTGAWKECCRRTISTLPPAWSW